ncbi:hypothetical protein ACQ4PT_046404 [Festuca glaucescens]
MEAALVSVAMGALKPVLAKLTSLLGDKYKHFKGVRKDIKSLTHELTAMDAFLMKMSEDKNPNVQDKIWMNEVRELSYNIEDTIDDFVQRVDDASGLHQEDEAFARKDEGSPPDWQRDPRTEERYR